MSSSHGTIGSKDKKGNVSFESRKDRFANVRIIFVPIKLKKHARTLLEFIDCMARHQNCLKKLISKISRGG